MHSSFKFAKEQNIKRTNNDSFTKNCRYWSRFELFENVNGSIFLTTVLLVKLYESL